MTSPELETYFAELNRRVRDVLADNLVGLYVVGSIAQGDQTPSSDVDVLGVVGAPISELQKTKLSKALDHASLAVPASGLDFLLVTQNTVQSPPALPMHEFWFSTGPYWPTEIDMGGMTDEHLIIFAICREQGGTLFGREASGMFAPIHKHSLMRALKSVVHWHRRKILDPLHDPQGQYSVLNACRAWRYAEEGVLSSKSAGAVWVLAKEPGNTLVKAALAMRRGDRSTQLESETIQGFLSRVIHICEEQLP